MYDVAALFDKKKMRKKKKRNMNENITYSPLERI